MIERKLPQKLSSFVHSSHTGDLTKQSKREKHREKKMPQMILEDRVFRGLFCFNTLLKGGIIDVARPCKKGEYFWQRHTQRITYGDL